MNCSRSNFSPAGFTLTELIISVALALLLIIGVNAVFKATGDTLSTGHAVATANRNEQSLHTVLAEDMRQLVLPEDAPFLLIRSRREAGFVDPADLDADTDYNPAGTADAVDLAMRTRDIDRDGVDGEAGVAGEQVPTTTYNSRNHRVDTLGFFARGRFARQTGTTALVDSLSTNEAYIWYGHLKTPEPGSSPIRFQGPGADYEGVKRGRTIALAEDPTTPRTRSNNPFNFFARDWTLGRAVVLLASAQDLNSDGNKDALFDQGGATAQAFFTRLEPDADFEHLSPLSINSVTVTGSGPRIQFSRYDVAGVTMQQFRWALAHSIGYLAAQPTPNHWAQHAYFDYRFQYDPRVNRPLDAYNAAVKTPALLQGCSQFMVEFAGDFISQSPDGAVTNNVPDGVLDFIRPFSGSDERRIRWYGMPRDTDGDGVIRGRPLASGGHANANDMVDVVPVAAVIMSAGPVPDNWFENINTSLPAPDDYAVALGPNDTYIAAWGPDTAAHGKPQYIRFIIGTIPATSGGSERIAEFVFSVK